MQDAVFPLRNYKGFRGLASRITRATEGNTECADLASIDSSYYVSCLAAPQRCCVATALGDQSGNRAFAVPYYFTPSSNARFMSSCLRPVQLAQTPLLPTAQVQQLPSETRRQVYNSDS